MPEIAVRKYAVTVEGIHHEGGPAAAVPLKRGAALAVIAGALPAGATFDINAWKAKYGAPLTPSQFYSSRPGPWGDYFNSNSADCANATFLYLGPLGVKARPFDQALSTAAFAALYPPDRKSVV